MTITRLTPSHGVLAKIALPLLVGLLLVGCNNADPYNSGQKVSGTILEPSDVNPLDPTKPATQVALFVNKPIKGLYYVCDDSNKTSSLMDKPSNIDGGDTDNVNLGTTIPVARCGNDASSVTFYLGGQNSLNTHHALALGKVDMPLYSPAGTDGHPRYCNDADACNGDDNGNGWAFGSIASSSFLFNYSIADMQAPPQRLNIGNPFNGDQCLLLQSGKAGNSCQVVYKATLLDALNTATSQGAEIVIPGRANDLMAEMAAYPGIDYSKLTFDYPDYAQFKTAWQPFVDAVCDGAEGAGCPGLPTSLMVNLDDSVGNGVARLRAGNYSLDYSSQLSVYGGLYFPLSQLLKGWQIKFPGFGVNMLAYPDGRLSGFGLAVNMKTICPDVSSSDLASVLSCLTFELKPENFVVVTGVGATPASIGGDLALNSANVVSLASASSTVNISLRGRFFGTSLYDGRTPQTTGDSGERTDFSLDFPDTSYVLKDAEKGSMVGNFFEVVLPDSSDGSVGVTSGDPVPVPVKISQTGQVQTVEMNETVLSQLRDHYYDMQLMRFCTVNESGCTDIPQPDKEVSASGGNYAPTSDGFEPSKETPMPTQLGGSETNVMLKFVDGDVDGSLLAELVDPGTCQLVMDGQGLPLRVGFIMATPDNSSADLTLLFTPPDVASKNKVPQLGISLSGRIDLTNGGAIYRLGDDNFSDRLRAHWADANNYRVSNYFRNSGVTQTDNLTTDEKQEVLSFAGGAVTGALLASCSPSP